MQYFTEEALKKSDFPFATALTSGAVFSPQQEERVHNHDCLEIVQVIAEGGYMIYNGQKYRLLRGDIWVINSLDYHMSYSTDGLLIRVLVFRTDLIWNAGSIPSPTSTALSKPVLRSPPANTAAA